MNRHIIAMINIIAKMNVIKIYISYILLVNAFYIFNVFLLLKDSFIFHGHLSWDFIFNLLVQQFLIYFFIMFLFFIISKTKLRIYNKAILFIVLYVFIAISLSVFLYFYAFSNIERFNLQNFIKRNLFTWIYIYIISWLYFYVVEAHSKLKR